MRLKRSASILALFSLLILLQVNVVSAAGRDGLQWSAGCNGFTNVRGGILLNRDNTGTGRESFTITAIDGAGNVLFGPVTESFFLFSRIYLGEGFFFPYNSAPTINPILVTLVSNAGNGLAAQTVYGVIGNCDGLPTLSTGQVVEAEVEVLDGSTSPSVALNADPPRPTNPEGIGFDRTGYLVVNTTSANLRSGDGPQYTIVGRVSGRTELVVLGRNRNRSWWYVQVGNIRGWINNTLVVVRGDLTFIPVVPVLGEIFPPRFYVFSIIDVRIAPSENALTLCPVDGDLEYLIVGRNPRGTWFEIQVMCDGVATTGWIPAEAGAIRNSGDLPIRVTSG